MDNVRRRVASAIELLPSRKASVEPGHRRPLQSKIHRFVPHLSALPVFVNLSSRTTCASFVLHTLAVIFFVLCTVIVLVVAGGFVLYAPPPYRYIVDRARFVLTSTISTRSSTQLTREIVKSKLLGYEPVHKLCRAV